MYQKFGLQGRYEYSDDKGRYNVTKKEEDMYFFKVPMWRNVTRTAPYFHDGSVWGLSQRDGAKALRIPYPTMRRYYSGSLNVPVPVLLTAQRLPLVDRNLRVIRMLNSGKLSMRDGPMTKAQLIDLDPPH